MDANKEISYVIKDEFITMTEMLANIEEKLLKYSSATQLAFIQPLKGMIFKAWLDVLNENDTFLNNYSKTNERIHNIANSIN